MENKKMKMLSTLSLSLAALAAMSLPLAAAEMTGKIKSLSTADDVFVLESGPTFYLAEGASLKGIKPGQTVTVTYDEQAGLMIASKITAKKTNQ
jgi:hypothetical protein